MFVTAALGSVHNGDLETAKQAIDSAAAAGANAVGFQFYGPDLMAKGTTASLALALEHKLPHKASNLQEYKAERLMHPVLACGAPRPH